MPQFSSLSHDTEGPIGSDGYLRGMGEEGWQLCAVCPIARSEAVRMYFVREQGVVRYWEYETVEYWADSFEPEKLADYYNNGWRAVATVHKGPHINCYYVREKK